MKTTNLDKWLYLVRRIEEHREEKAVKELQKVYKGLIRDLRKVMGNLFADYADPETGRLRYAELHRQGLDARLLEEVAANVNSVTQDERRIIMETVEQTYANCYSGMVQAVEKAVNNDELKEAFSSVEAVKPEVLRAAVNNPVHGLTLSDQLEKNRADIVWGIKQAVGVGLSEGDNYTTMAKRIQKELIGPDGAGGSYYKAIRIARTEAHRVREEGNLDAAQNLTEKLEPAGITMVKTWHTMKDERVRPNRARKTKGGWKYSRGGKYDHQKMEGVQVPINDEFTLPSGAKTQAPGKSGVAGEDINCRCFLSYDVVQNAVPAPEMLKIPENTSVDIKNAYNDAMVVIPSSHKAILDAEIKNVKIDTVGNSRYDRDTKTLYIGLTADKEEIVHEFAHALETNLGLYFRSDFKKILKSGMTPLEWSNITYVPDEYGKPVFFAVNPKFVSEYQGRLYDELDFWDDSSNDGSVNPFALAEYFSEGYKEFCFRPKQLKKKDPDLYEYIMRLI